MDKELMKRMGFANLDLMRKERTGAPEAIFCRTVAALRYFQSSGSTLQRMMGASTFCRMRAVMPG